jgi:hypothetical protein
MREGGLISGVSSLNSSSANGERVKCKEQRECESTVHAAICPVADNMLTNVVVSRAPFSRRRQFEFLATQKLANPIAGVAMGGESMVICSHANESAPCTARKH